MKIDEPSEKLTTKFAEYFDGKVRNVYAGLENSIAENQNIDVVALLPRTQDLICPMTEFTPLSVGALKQIIMNMPTKTCDLDPIPTSLLKVCIDTVLPALLHIVNLSLTSGLLSLDLKMACIVPRLKKESLDINDLKNYRPISNLSFLSKLLEKCVYSQINEHLLANHLLSQFQSAYRQHHSSETALVKVHNDIVQLLDSNLNVMVMSFDLSCAFDTVDHTHLINKLHHRFGIDGTILSWFTSYLQSRQFFVKLDDTVSENVKLFSGVPQGSILGPLLFNLYCQDIEKIAVSHNIGIHICADDIQCYFSFDKTMLLNTVKIKIANFMSDLKAWMNSNYLQLNELKTQFVEMLPPGREHAKLIPNLNLGGSDVFPTSVSVKMLGVILDQDMSLSLHINKVINVCYLNLCNLGRIGSKLSHELKLQLVHSMILSHLDYCNALYYHLPVYLLKKLTGVLHAAVRFIFGLYGSLRRVPISPYLKSLHILPMKFRIMFKIALMTYKCFHNLAPAYIKHLLSFHQPIVSHNVRSNTDHLKLEPKQGLNFVKSQGMFCFAAPEVWNVLPLSVRHSDSVSQFKCRLKSHYFSLAFCDVDDL